MSVVLCLPAHLRVSRSVPWPAPDGNASVGYRVRRVMFVVCRCTVVLEVYWCTDLWLMYCIDTPLSALWWQIHALPI